jgi:hypothetical protein
MGGQEAIWHVSIDDKQQGPLTKDEVLAHLKSSMLAGTDLIWRPGFSGWQPVKDTEDFWQPPQRASKPHSFSAAPPPPPPPETEHTHEEDNTVSHRDREKWSLWKAANIGMTVSIITNLMQIGLGQGYELANYARTASVETISNLTGRFLAIPLIFLLITLVRNLFFFRQPRSSKSSLWGALTFAALAVCIIAGLTLHQEIFYHSTDQIAGEARKSFIANAASGCISKQHSFNQNVTDSQIEHFCNCVSEKLADGTTYNRMGGGLDHLALANFRERGEAAANACR